MVYTYSKFPNETWNGIKHILGFIWTTKLSKWNLEYALYHSKFHLETWNRCIPLASILSKGSTNDGKLLNETFDSFLVNIDPLKYKNNNKYKQYLLADKGYDFKKIFQFGNQHGYTVIIPQNKRNIKDPQKIRFFTKFQEKKYNKRIIVENHFCWIKKNRRLLHRYDRYSVNYQKTDRSSTYLVMDFFLWHILNLFSNTCNWSTCMLFIVLLG